MTVCVKILSFDCTALDITKVAHPASIFLQKGPRGLTTACQPSDSRHLSGTLLRARRQRPSSRCTADKHDELTPSHRLPQGSGPGIVTGQTGSLEVAGCEFEV